MGKCLFCGKTSITISDVMGACINCIRNNPEALRHVLELHDKIRAELSKPPQGQRTGVVCSVCGRGCSLSSLPGYCGVRYAEQNSIRSFINQDEVLGFYYYDPHPTNCVAIEVCPASKGIGFPKYALSRSGEVGYYNIAVFLGSCNLNCLYCQNWEHHLVTARKKPTLSFNDLESAVNARTTCVCFFGGDPSVFAPSLLIATRRMIEKARQIGLRVFRVCFETNGLWNPFLLEKAVELSLETGGIIKIDFKAWSPQVYSALTGVETRHVYIIRENIKRVAKRFNERSEPPLLVVSTLLVPGYIDEYEIDGTTKFIANLNPDIPYVFLGFHPDFHLRDLPTTSWSHANKALKIARENGLKRVFLGNVFILGNSYD